MQPPGNAAREELRAQLVSRIPPNYSPRRHLLIPSTLGLLGMAALLALVHDLRPRELLAIPLALLGGLGLEWRVHRDLLHKRHPRLAILYDRHERMHHVVFTHDDMGLRSRREMGLVLLPPFAIVPLLGMLLPMGLILAQLVPRNAALLAIATSLGFFLLYEWLHLAYHLPPETFVGRNPLIAALARAAPAPSRSTADEALELQRHGAAVRLAAPHPLVGRARRPRRASKVLADVALPHRSTAARRHSERSPNRRPRDRADEKAAF